MRLEVLLSTMNQYTSSIVEEANITGDVLIINQGSYHDYYEEDVSPRQKVRMYSFDEKGVGLSRNTALMRASGDILLLADDDVIFHEDYESIILKAFQEHRHADVLIFNVPSLNAERKGPKRIEKTTRIHSFNFMRYGAVNIAFRKSSIYKANIFFSLLYGGGASYNAGEDTLFLYDCLSKGLKVIGYPAEIGVVKQEGSSWFRGFDEKYFHDKGVLYTNLSHRYSYFFILQFALRKYSIYKKEHNLSEALKFMFAGRRHFLKEHNEYED